MIQEYFDTMAKFRQNLADHPDWRKGQSLFNAVAECWPFAAEQIRGRRDLDPFYRDELVGECTRYLAALAWIPK